MLVAMRLLRALVLVPMLLLLFPASAAAADIRQGNDIVIGTAETIDDDLYAFGNNIAINGTVNGDVVAAGQNISVDGTVTGNLIAAGRSVTIRGQVGGSVRAVGATVFVDGKVGGDLFAASDDVTVSANGKIGRDVVAAGSTLTLGGQTGRRVEAAFRAVTIDGHVSGNVRTQGESLRLTEHAAVDGSLSYTSANEATVASGAVVRGATTRTTPAAGPAEPGPAAIAIDWARGLVGLLILGLFLVLFFPAFSRRAGEALARSPFVSLGVGVVFLIGLPILAIVLFVVGAYIGGWWLGLVALAFYFAALAVSLPVAALGLGASILRVTRRPAQLVIALIVGLVVLLLVGLVPILGGIVLLLACLFGLGGAAIAVVGGRRAETVAA